MCKSKKIIALVLCFVYLFASCSTSHIDIESSSLDEENSAPEIMYGPWFDNEVEFYYDKTTTLTFEDLTAIEHYDLIRNLDMTYPVTIFHFNSKFNVEKFSDDNGDYMMFYTIYNLTDGQLAYVTLKEYGYNYGQVIDQFILYPFENEEDEEYIGNLVLEKDLPENILARSK